MSETLIEQNRMNPEVLAATNVLSKRRNRTGGRTCPKIYTASLDGLHPVLTQAEADISRGLPSFSIVGLGDASIKEARERIRPAIKNSGFEFPFEKKVINLTPADLKKQGSLFDFPVAVSILLASGQLQIAYDEPVFCAGELMLSGRLRKVPGILPITCFAKSKGFKKIFIPFANREEASLVGGIEIFPIKHLKEFTDHISGRRPVEKIKEQCAEHMDVLPAVDFADIYGQEVPKRALEIAAAGQHHVLMIGPPGTGKTMLAKAFGGICPDLTREESLEVSMIYSVADKAGKYTLPIIKRPFRQVHHSTTSITISGGGNPIQMGEVSLAHKGVLFLDEFAEFNKCVIEGLREPLQEGIIRLGKFGKVRNLPAEFQLIAAMNPCPCGYFGDASQNCKCTAYQINQYYKRISGPILDRIDVIINVPRISRNNFEKNILSEKSSEVLKRVAKAISIQKARGIPNREMQIKDIKPFCHLNKESEKFLAMAVNSMNISTRSYLSVLRISRTIADLECSKSITKKHIAEALQYKKPIAPV